MEIKGDGFFRRNLSDPYFLIQGDGNQGGVDLRSVVFFELVPTI